MPESRSSWSRLFSWFFGRREPEPVVEPPVTPVSGDVAEPQPTINELLDIPIPPRAPPPLPGEPEPADMSLSVPDFQPAGDPLPPPDNGGDEPQDPQLPTEGPNLGFRRLWNNHPTPSTGEKFPCRDAEGMPHFNNQCAILMGTCLLESQLLHGYDKTTCWYRGHKGHTLRARELSDWMRRHPERFGRVEIRKNVTWGAFRGRTGFVCFHNFWGQNNQGDHIDLWDGTGIIRRETDPRLEGPGLADGSLDYFERSEEVWFWPVH